MKTNFGIKIFLIYLALLSYSCQAGAQEYKENETRDLNFNSGAKVFILDNVFGGVKIDATDGNKGKLDIEKIIIADSKSEYEKAKNELNVKIENSGDTVLVYLYAPFITVKRNKRGISYCFDKDDADYRFRFNFVAKIPKDAEIIVSAINDGDIDVDGITGKMDIHNVNGGISLKNVEGKASLNTVNGPIVADFKKNPPENCNFKTINGDIKIFCDKNLSTDVNYKTMNGEFYTNYIVSALEPERISETKKIDGSTFYKIGTKPHFRIGDGKIKMSFETLNVNMTVKYKE